MTLIEAMRTGHPFSRTNPDTEAHAWIIVNGDFFLFRDAVFGPPYDISPDDVLADDWEIDP
jgi:hypothetical protein